MELWSKVIDYIEYLCWAIFFFTLVLVKLGYVSFEDLSFNYEEQEDFNKKRTIWALGDDSMVTALFFIGLLIAYYMRQNQRDNQHKRSLQLQIHETKNLYLNKLEKALPKIKKIVPKSNDNSDKRLSEVNQKNQSLEPCEIKSNEPLTPRKDLKEPKTNAGKVKLQKSDSVVNISESHPAIAQLEKNISSEARPGSCNQTKPMFGKEPEVGKLVVTPTRTSILRKYASRKIAPPAKTELDRHEISIKSAEIRKRENENKKEESIKLKNQNLSNKAEAVPPKKIVASAKLAKFEKKQSKETVVKPEVNDVHESDSVEIRVPCKDMPKHEPQRPVPELKVSATDLKSLEKFQENVKKIQLCGYETVNKILLQMMRENEAKNAETVEPQQENGGEIIKTSVEEPYETVDYPADFAANERVIRRRIVATEKHSNIAHTRSYNSSDITRAKLRPKRRINSSEMRSRRTSEPEKRTFSSHRGSPPNMPARAAASTKKSVTFAENVIYLDSRDDNYAYADDNTIESFVEPDMHMEDSEEDEIENYQCQREHETCEYFESDVPEMWDSQSVYAAENVSERSITITSETNSEYIMRAPPKSMKKAARTSHIPKSSARGTANASHITKSDAYAKMKTPTKRLVKRSYKEETQKRCADEVVSHKSAAQKVPKTYPKEAWVRGTTSVPRISSDQAPRKIARTLAKNRADQPQKVKGILRNAHEIETNSITISQQSSNCTETSSSSISLGNIEEDSFYETAQQLAQMQIQKGKNVHRESEEAEVRAKGDTKKTIRIDKNKQGTKLNARKFKKEYIKEQQECEQSAITEDERNIEEEEDNEMQNNRRQLPTKSMFNGVERKQIKVNRNAQSLSTQKQQNVNASEQSSHCPSRLPGTKPALPSARKNVAAKDCNDETGTFLTKTQQKTIATEKEPQNMNTIRNTFNVQSFASKIPRLGGAMPACVSMRLPELEDFPKFFSESTSTSEEADVKSTNGLKNIDETELKFSKLDLVSEITEALEEAASRGEGCCPKGIMKNNENDEAKLLQVEPCATAHTQSEDSNNSHGNFSQLKATGILKQGEMERFSGEVQQPMQTNTNLFSWWNLAEGIVTYDTSIIQQVKQDSCFQVERNTMDETKIEENQAYAAEIGDAAALAYGVSGEIREELYIDEAAEEGDIKMATEHQHAATD